MSVLQIRFYTLVFVLSAFFLFLFVFLRWDKKTISERTFEIRKASRPKDIKSFHLHYKFNNVAVTVSGRKAIPQKVWTEKGDNSLKTASGQPLPAVVLFHDTHKTTFSAKTWETLGTLRLITGLGHTAYAIDLPGFGKTRIMGELSHHDFIDSILKELNLPNVVLVVPGYSALYVMPFLFDESAKTRAHVVGLVAVATYHAATFTSKDFAQIKNIKSFYVYGEKDVSHENIEAIKRFQDVKDAGGDVAMEMMKDAGDYCYLDQPKHWHKLMKRFLTELDDKM